MSLFGSIVDRIVHLAQEAAGGGASAPAAGAATPRPPAPGTPSPAIAASAVPSDGAPGPAPSGPASAPPATALPAVDIGAVLAARAAQTGQTLHWQSSIVDLLKLLDLDSSLEARKQLAGELDVHAGADGSAEENTALHRAVVAKLEANGGNVPAAMKT